MSLMESDVRKAKSVKANGNSRPRSKSQKRRKPVLA
jgi:hypothetical protein